MKRIAIVALFAIVLVVACGSDVTGPEVGDPPPDTTWEHTVLLRAEVYNTVPDPAFAVYWLEEGENLCNLGVDGTLWEYEMEGSSGDSLWIKAFGWGDEWMLVSIYVDSAWCASSGDPYPPGERECSYIIP